MKNKKGFTLIELLAVIVVLAIILVIAGTSVIGYINSSKEKAKFIAAKEIASMAEAYFAVNTDKTYVSVKTLVDEKYLESDVTNPATGENISSSSEVSKQYIINRGIKDYENQEGEYITESISYIYGGEKLEELESINIEENPDVSISITDNGEIIQNIEIGIADLKNYNNETINYLGSAASGWSDNKIRASYVNNYVTCYFEIPNLKYYSDIKINYRTYKNHDYIDSKIIFDTIESMDDNIDISKAIKIEKSSYNKTDFVDTNLEIVNENIKINNNNYFVIRLDRGEDIGTVPVGYTAVAMIDSIELIP